MGKDAKRVNWERARRRDPTGIMGDCCFLHSLTRKVHFSFFSASVAGVKLGSSLTAAS